MYNPFPFRPDAPFPLAAGACVAELVPGVRLRLTGGQGRGRRLASASLGGLRPTAARVREALFDILGGRVAGAEVLDVFAGTGAIGIEALSRGARRVVFVESDARAARLIVANLRAAGLTGDATVVASDALRALERLAARGASFAIVFLDPPYAAGASSAILERSAALVATGGVLVVEADGRRGADIVAPGLRAGRRYRYGDSRLSVFHRDPPAAERRG